MFMEQFVIDPASENLFIVEEVHFLLVAHGDAGMLCEKIMKRGCP